MVHHFRAMLITYILSKWLCNLKISTEVNYQKAQLWD